MATDQKHEWHVSVHGTLVRFERFHDGAGLEVVMLRWAFVFLVIGLVAGVLGFTGLAGAAIFVAKVLFFVFMAIFLGLLIAGLVVARKITSS